MPGFTPKDVAFEARVRESFSRQRVMKTIGAQLAHVSAGEVHISLPFRADLTQQHGFLHAGIVATILDSACGYAAFTLMPADAGVLSIEYKINLLAPARGETIIARGSVLRAGRTITVTSGGAFSVAESGEIHVAEILASMMTVLDRKDVRS